MKRSRIMTIGIVIALVLFVALIFMAKTGIRRFFYPTAPPMPVTVATPVSEVIVRLESVLKTKAPYVLESLQPGLTSEQIGNLEKESGIRLPDEIRAIYQWRNGTARPSKGVLNDFIPIHRFLSLEEALGEKTITQSQVSKATTLQRAASRVFAGHRDSWICLFSDGAGDGYYFDPTRKLSEGAVFYCFAETTSYTFFPSIKNLLSAITKCYERDVFYIKQGSNPPELEENFELAPKIWHEFGSDNNE